MADNVNDDDDERLLLEASASLLMSGGDGDNDDDEYNGGVFISEEQRAEEAAEQRRIEREKKRQRRMLMTMEEEKQTNTDDSRQRMTTNFEDKSIEPSKAEQGPLKSSSDAYNSYGRSDNTNDGKDDNDDDDDSFDMFSSSVSPPSQHPISKSDNNSINNSISNNQSVTKSNPKKIQGTDGNHQRDFDDSEGYYKATIGEIISLSLGSTDESSNVQVRVQGIIGKGVFSSVLKCSVTSIPHASGPLMLPDQEVALKCIRSNETMTKAAMNEIKVLQRLSNCAGIVQLLLPTATSSTQMIEHRGHTILVFPYEPYNLRDVLIKFGKGVGLSLMAVKNFFGQLLAAATHLMKHKILHADIKPDNLLVSESYSQILIADFGSAMDLSDPNNSELITPYLASRFYRAPEVILGMPPTYSIDLWSLAVTAAEIFLGNVLFQGQTNNDMLYKMMTTLGPMSNRQIRRNLLQAKKNPIPIHFTQNQTNYFFRQESVDPVLGRPVHKEISLTDNAVFKSTLQSKLLKARSPKDSRSTVISFADLLNRCLAMDPSKRISVKDALRHEFFKNDN